MTNKVAETAKPIFFCAHFRQHLRQNVTNKVLETAKPTHFFDSLRLGRRAVHRKSTRRCPIALARARSPLSSHMVMRAGSRFSSSPNHAPLGFKLRHTMRRSQNYRSTTILNSAWRPRADCIYQLLRPRPIFRACVSIWGGSSGSWWVGPPTGPTGRRKPS